MKSPETPWASQFALAFSPSAGRISSSERIRLTHCRLKHEDDSPTALAPRAAARRVHGEGPSHLRIHPAVASARLTCRGCRACPAVWLNDTFLREADPDALTCAAEEFYDQVVPLPLFAESLRRHADRVRDGIHHIVFSQDVMPVKVERCISENGAFSVCGLGAAFWSAIAKSLDSLRLPAWTADTVAGGAAAWIDPPQKNLVRRSHRRLRVAFADTIPG